MLEDLEQQSVAFETKADMDEELLSHLVNFIKWIIHGLGRDFI